MVLIGTLDQANGSRGIADRVGKQVCREAFSRRLVVLTRGVKADDRVEVHDAAFLILGHLDIPNPDEGAQLPLGEPAQRARWRGR